MLRTAFFAALTLHGLIHLIGFASAFGYARTEGMPDIGRSQGALWLATSVLFLVATGGGAAGRGWWAGIALVAAFLSQALIATAWDAAKWGTVLNALVLLAVAPTIGRALPGSLFHRHQEAVASALAPSEDQRTDSIVTEEDLKRLPGPVARYLRFSGALGKPVPRNVRVVFTGRMRGSPKGPWMSIRAMQHDFFDREVRTFHVESSLFGLPFEGFHLFDRGAATMEVHAASLVPVVNASGPKMDQSETVTYFNDMCLLAPATLLDRRIEWTPVDDHTVRAVFGTKKVRIEATLTFDDSGALANFVSVDRFLSADGKTYESHPWETPVSDYRSLAGRRMWTTGRAVWRFPTEPFPYAEFELVEIGYDIASN